MSAPIVACTIADAIGAMLPTLTKAMGCHCTIEYFAGSPEIDRTWFTIYLHDHGRAFSGNGDTLSRALMDANEARQTHGETLARIAA